MQSAPSAGYEPNKLKLSSFRSNPPKLTNKDKLPDYSPTLPEPFVQAVLDILSKHGMIDMMQPDLWEWVPSTRLDEIINSAKDVIPMNSPIVPTPVKDNGNFTRSLFSEQKDLSITSSDQAQFGTPGRSFDGSTYPKGDTSSGSSKMIKTTMLDLQQNIKLKVKNVQKDITSDNSEISQVIASAPKSNLPPRYLKLVNQAIANDMVWYNTKSLVTEDRERRLFRFQMDDLIKEKVKSSHPYLYDKAIKGDFPTILTRMMSTHQLSDPAHAGGLMNKFFDGDTYAKKHTEPMTVWFGRVSKIISEIERSGVDLPSEVIRARVIHYLKHDNRYNTLILEAEENALSLQDLIHKCYARATSINDIPKANSNKATANEVNVDKPKRKGKGKRGKGIYTGPASSGKPCSAFRDTGSCSYGDKCVHFHGNPDPRIALRKSKNGATKAHAAEATTSTIDCESNDIPSTEESNVSESADAASETDATANVATSKNSKDVRPSSKKTYDTHQVRRECVEFTQEGHCKYGDTCKFAHVGSPSKKKATASFAVTKPSSIKHSMFGCHFTKFEMEINAQSIMCDNLDDKSPIDFHQDFHPATKSH
jgi:hypothetical protein